MAVDFGKQRRQRVVEGKLYFGVFRWCVLLSAAVWILSACDEDSRGKLEIVRLAPQVIFQLGELDGDGPEVFGDLTGIVVDPTGHFFVLDEHSKSVKRFSSHGEFLEEFGREGEGPGEFRGPSGLATDGASHLYVVDAALQRMSVFRTDGPEVIHERDVRLPFTPRKMCTLKERIFVLGLYENHALHELTSSGEILRSFGEIPETIDPEVSPRWQDVLRRGASGGMLECAEQSGVVAFLPTAFPLLRAFTPEGSEVLRVELDDFRKQTYNETDYGTLQFLLNQETGTVHLPVSLVEIEAGLLLVQLVETDRRPDDLTPESRLVRIWEGTQFYSPDSLPRIATLDGSRAFAFSNSPVPTIFALRWDARN